MRYEMKLNNLPFEQISANKKTIEIRLNDAKRQLLRIGDEILFINREKPVKTIIKVVKDLRLYKTFNEMAMNEDCVLAGFDNNYTIQEVVDCYYSYYSAEEEKQFGVIAIELK